MRRFYLSACWIIRFAFLTNVQEFQSFLIEDVPFMLHAFTFTCSVNKFFKRALGITSSSFSIRSKISTHINCDHSDGLTTINSDSAISQDKNLVQGIFTPFLAPIFTSILYDLLRHYISNIIQPYFLHPFHRAVSMLLPATIAPADAPTYKHPDWEVFEKIRLNNIWNVVSK